MNTTTYEVISYYAFISSKPTIFSSILGFISKGSNIEVVSISNDWASFYYNGKSAYIRLSSIKLVPPKVTGSVTIKYIDEISLSEISYPTLYTNQAFSSYTYNSMVIPGYTVSGSASQAITLTATNPNQIITFKYKKILGTVTIRYIDESTLLDISNQVINSTLSLGSYTYNALIISGYSISSDSTQTVTLTDSNPNQIIIFKYTDLYLIDLVNFNISNINTNSKETTLGINKALSYAKQQGFKKTQLPAGNYLIENDTIQQVKTFIDVIDSTKTWITKLKGIVIPDNFTFIIENCTLNLEPSKYSEQTVINFANSHNSQLIGGTILGDRDTHLFELVINKDGRELESGDFDSTNGLPILDTTKMRTINHITNIEDGSPLPSNFIICPLANTTMNTVDGGSRYIYCYDKENNYLGKSTGNNSFLTIASLPIGTAKIKVSFRGETRNDSKYYLSIEKTYVTYEQSYGIRIYGSNNITINGTTINNFLTDGIITMPFPINHINNDLKILNCTIENNRRQGISFVGTSDGILVQNCKIGKTQGVDPQCGIDFEHYSYVKNTVIDNCDFYDNKKWDIINYNGWDIEIKNCRFNGSIASTYGYNMNINHNKFIYYNAPWLDKTFKGTLFSLNTNNSSDVYFKINNNSIDGYNSLGGNRTSTLISSEFTGNEINNSHMVIGINPSSNIYTNSTVRYSLCDYEYKNEKLTNCILGGENNGNNIKSRYYTNFDMNNCTFSGGNPSVVNTILSNCNIYNNNNSFCSVWTGPYTIDNSNIITEYASNIPFISSQGIKGAIFTNSNMNLSCTQFIGANYGIFNMNNCTIIFNESYLGQDTLNFYTNVYGSAIFENNKFYKNFSSPKIKLPDSINSTANNNNFITSLII